MRIISGIHKGRIIKIAKSFNARPTTDYAKESLFNILTNKFDFSGLNILDLFAGTGSISFEFASRGVENIIAVEKNAKYITTAKQFAEMLYQEDNLSPIKFIAKDAFKYIAIEKLNFDIIFADPPYDNPQINKIPDIIFKNNTLKKGAVIILEHPDNYNFSNYENFEQTRKYGRVNFSFFKNK